MLSNKPDMELVCLDDYKHLMDATIDLLNSQWPRSRSARLRSLEQGNREKFPLSLLLISTAVSEKELVIGHSKVTPVPYTDAACFVESVVIDKSYRGKGYGRLIMEKTEDFVKKKGVTCIYLTTHDQQEFYMALGYEFCEPIMVFGGASVAFHERIKTLQLGSTPVLQNGVPSEFIPASAEAQKPTSSVCIEQVAPVAVSKIPSPPTPPAMITISSPGLNTSSKVHMKKVLL